jgi:hypothetical protein
MQGDLAGFKQHAAKAGLPPAPDIELPPIEALTEDFDLALDSLVEDDETEDDADAVEASNLSLTLLRKMLIGPMGVMALTPGTLKRAAVAALPKLGEAPLAVCQRYLTPARIDTIGMALHQGVADVLRAHHAQLPPAEVQALVEHGLRIGGAPTRKTFYELGAELYGPAFMEQALRDNANSIRQWAAKKLGGEPPKKRGRKPRAK